MDKLLISVLEIAFVSPSTFSKVHSFDFFLYNYVSEMELVVKFFWLYNGRLYWLQWNSCIEKLSFDAFVVIIAKLSSSQPANLKLSWGEIALLSQLWGTYSIPPTHSIEVLLRPSPLPMPVGSKLQLTLSKQPQLFGS